MVPGERLKPAARNDQQIVKRLPASNLQQALEFARLKAIPVAATACFRNIAHISLDGVSPTSLAARMPNPRPEVTLSPTAPQPDRGTAKREALLLSLLQQQQTTQQLLLEQRFKSPEGISKSGFDALLPNAQLMRR